eukprot:c10394_g1_i1.p1 GENE.c10394_g1_i1~~c10394_g1_i1.p1  ORF type:complete len:554 (-),score=96.02 c10394_g1_i1:394-2055(-)
MGKNTKEVVGLVCNHPSTKTNFVQVSANSDTPHCNHCCSSCMRSTSQTKRQIRSSSDVAGDDCKPFYSPQLNPSPELELQLDQLLLSPIRITEEEYFAHPKAFKAPKTMSAQQQAPNSAREKPTVEHFDWLEELGEGSYGTVRRARLRTTGQEFAVKILEKKHIIKMGKVKYVTSERDILFQLNHPNVIKLHYTFQDDACLYFVMELAPCGELFEQIQKHGPADLSCARFYAAEIVNALEYLHSKGIVHRDLKPENMLVAADGHIKISDFGSATADKQTDSKMTFVGTAEYVSPEVLNGGSASESSDLWALGCVIYQLLVGQPPFRGDTDYIIFEKILARKFVFPDHFPQEARDLVDRLLVIDPNQRLGAGGHIMEIKKHPFFLNVNFETLHLKTPPPFKVETTPNSSTAAAPTSSQEQFCAFDTFQRGPLDVFEVQALVEKQAQYQIHTKWKQFLLPSEAVVMAGMAHKRVGLFARPRQFVLTTYPRLIYINMERHEKRGEVPWDQITKVEVRDSSTLYIHTHARVYYLEAVTDPSRWFEAIEFMRKNPVQS